MTDIEALADFLHTAARQVTEVDPWNHGAAGFDLATAYQVQDAVVARRVAEGERIVGAKLGLTSRAKQQAMGVHEPLYAWLTDAMNHPAEKPLQLDGFIHPRVEPEIAFVMAQPLKGPGVGVLDVLAATGAVAGALEIIDSRYRDFRFTLPDAVADNASSAAFVLGPLQHPADFDLSLVGCVLEVDGQAIDSAAGAALLGHPAEAVAALANDLGRRGISLEPGWVILAGGLTAPVALSPATSVVARFSRLGTVRLLCDIN
ncbi:2-keto-4-pentenoate hydratase [Nonomuraea guangzhouensis]|uniref:2-keto-4-pentenoate hydratase n=1 Tax=Nonomuraea guangzhouensis TaxID=1291555 RepID=A0ABW4GAX6_9ACTN|nr:fumarylacetoacetate hydrolase family protein [Nonomuraea guangzhouensis]